ncbi:hypothetical protein FOZ62_026224, partial [Perkinsus olseni]
VSTGGTADNFDSDDKQKHMSLDNFDVVILESLFFDGEQYTSPLEEARIRRALEGNDEVEGDDAVQQAPADEQPVLRAKRRAKDKALENLKAFLDAQSDESGFEDLDSLND